MDALHCMWVEGDSGGIPNSTTSSCAPAKRDCDLSHGAGCDPWDKPLHTQPRHCVRCFRWWDLSITAANVRTVLSPAANIHLAVGEEVLRTPKKPSLPQSGDL